MKKHWSIHDFSERGTNLLVDNYFCRHLFEKEINILFQRGAHSQHPMDRRELLHGLFA